MKLVAFETSGKTGSVAAAWGANADLSIRQKVLPQSSRSAQSLAPTLADLIRDLGWQAHDLQAVAVASGPGSFTGLRVGVTTAKLLAYAAGCQVVEVNTLATIAHQASQDAPADSPVWAILDAQRGELFGAKFRAGNQEVPTQIISRERWLEMLAPGDTVAGPVLDRLAGELPAGVRVASQTSWLPTAATVARLAVPLAQQGVFTDPLELVPRYHRLSAAEEKAMRAESEG
ncbi:MAG: tRNA (adenosine(37)-N6)-threonylcarbamoyltransferase complex dimerization subunit type 1 TsaB [Planctomycetales bacterium]|nr:tRNA (adenosine(37)-N6)-threonylcarbamoyltransferase complex dimerization subunit type 1 TsaB [Planctomycetales bacterium]